MSEAQQIRAWRRAEMLYPLSSGFRRAYVRGATAALQGRPYEDCPYRNRRGWRAWRSAWLRGYRSIHLRSPR